jgi:hypothetical protein
LVVPTNTARTSSAKKSRARVAEKADALPPGLRLKHKPSGKERRVGTGFAWDLFLFAGILGLPLFWRRLPNWGAAVLVLWLLVLGTGAMRSSGVTDIAQIVLFGVFLVLQLYLGFYGNRINVQTLLAHGWVIDQNDGATKRLIERWRLAS